MRRDMAEREESRDEMALRATLHARAGEMVDTDAAWAAVAPRLAASGAVVSHKRRIGSLAGVSRGMLVAAAMMALVVALAGAGVVYWGDIFGGPKTQVLINEQLFTTIGQRQTIDGVTVSIDRAYADPDDTIIIFTFTMPYDMASRYSNVIANRMEITDAAGNEAHGMGTVSNYVCEPLWRDPLFHRDGAEHCLIDLGPFQPPAGASSLNLRFEAGELWLFRATDHEREILSGPWRFQFTVPFHQQSHGPAGPYAPASSTP